MTQRTQWIVLGVLLCALAVVAVITLRKGQPAPTPAPAEQAGAPATTQPAQPSAAQPQPARAPESELLDPAKYDALRAWFITKGNAPEITEAVAFKFGRPIPKPTPGTSQVATTTRTTPDTTAPAAVVEPPPALQGTLWVNGVGMALFQGEAVRPNEPIRGTAYTVASVVGGDVESVVVKSADGKVTTLTLSE